MIGMCVGLFPVALPGTVRWDASIQECSPDRGGVRHPSADSDERHTAHQRDHIDTVPTPETWHTGASYEDCHTQM